MVGCLQIFLKATGVGLLPLEQVRLGRWPALIYFTKLTEVWASLRSF